MAFSGALVSTTQFFSSTHGVTLNTDKKQTLTDLNDYITPSQACIKPVETKNAPIGDVDGGAASVL